jgi:phenylacetic acid degradation operon negative regulatory protein
MTSIGQPVAEDRLSARDLILALMDSASAASLDVSYFLAAGDLFDMEPGGIRVALARLTRDGSLAQPERGRYERGNRAGQLQQLVRNWSRAEEAVTNWRGGWLAVQLGHLARSNKTRNRSNARALGLFGFAEALPGFWVRPDNLTHPLAELRNALLDLGLDERALLMRMVETEPAEPFDPHDLWDTPALEARYQSHLKDLQHSLDHIDDLDERSAARETLLLGRAVTRDILLDPLLPGEFIDTALRQRMIRAMRDYDRIGKRIWRAFYASHQSA